MADDIFLIQNDGELVEMSEHAYDSEALLQELLAKYPKLLAGGQMDTSSPRRWLLVRREMGVPSTDDGGGRWSVDHLFLDQDAIPTLVEVKRSTDTRLRREVIGQMLDYAANAVVYWPVEKIRAEFEKGFDDADEELAQLLGEESDAEEFWETVKTNLQAGKIRMVFVADIIPTELRRIIEFLNEQMDPAEVLAVEIKQFVGKEMKTLVPRVIGHTKKNPPRPSGAKRIDEEARLAFWTAFCEKASKDAPHLQLEQPTGEARLALSVAIPDASVFVVADYNAKNLATRLALSGSLASRKGSHLKKYLEEHGNLLKHRWGSWDTKGGKVICFHTGSEKMNLTEEQAWPECQQWLLDAIDELFKKLLPEIQ